MAEHILGLLLVTQSSRERNVFRYPPDPTSPSDRLSQPIYPRATYTAQDTTVDNAGHRRMFKKFQDGNRTSSRGMSSNASHVRRGSDGRPGASGFSRVSGQSRRGASESGTADESASLFGPSAGGSIHSHVTEVESGDSDSSSDESEFDTIWEGTGQAANRRFSSGTETSSRTVGAGTNNSGPRALTEIRSHSHSHDRRGSPASEETIAKTKKHCVSIESQYNSSMGYSLDFLSDLLSPPRNACNRKFEISVDELVFLGHPVCSNSEGKWVYPADDSDDEDRDVRRVSRGRKMESGVRDLSLGAVAEHPESPQSARSYPPNWSGMRGGGSSTETSSGAVSGTDTPGSVNHLRTSTTLRKDDKTDEAQLSMFHLVLILDKPNPQPDEDEDDILNEVYREIAFKWTAAAFALQVRDNWVAREVRDLHKIREKAMQDHIPVHECLQKCIEKTQIAESLHQLFSALHKIKGRPVNGHFSNLSTTLKVDVGSIPVTIVVPPKTVDADGNSGDLDSSDSDSDDEWGLTTGPDGAMLAKQPSCPVEPWKTLLILDADEVSREHARDRDRRASQIKLEEDDLVDQLIDACDVSKPLSEIAHLLRCDFEGVIIPLARELIQNKRAVLVDVVNIRLRSILIPTKVSDHLRSITQHAVRFSVAFPKLPPLITFIAMISQRLVPFRDLLPPEAQADPGKRDPWVRAVAWLLRNDLVTQAHMRARVVASGAIKEAAWRRLWHRRRRRWLRERRDSQASQASATSRGSRPSFGESGQVASPNSDRTDHGTLGSGWPPLAARVPRTPLAVTRTLSMGETLADPDSDFEMDSDVEGDDVAELIKPPPGVGCEEEYTMEVDEPGNVPTFSASFIFHPSRAQKDEARWLRVIRERTSDAVMRSRFDMCVQYFDGVTTFEEIVFRTGLSRRELDRISHIFRDDLMVTIHP